MRNSHFFLVAPDTTWQLFTVEMAGDSLSTAIVISSDSEDEEEEIESDGALVFTPTKR